MNKLYLDKTRTIEDRVDNLLSMMTIKEKIGQLNQMHKGWECFRKNNNTYEVTKEFKDEVAFGNGVGAIYSPFRYDGWNMDKCSGVKQEDSIKVIELLQNYIKKNTRLGIPALITEECSHGHEALDGTIYPVNIGVGSSFNPELYEEAMSLVAKETRTRGATLALISTLDILQDPRWGRSEECYSEDPYLAAEMCKAAVRGIQGENNNDIIDQDHMVAVVKHFCGQGSTVGGHNGTSSLIGEREIREIHLIGMKAAIEVGALGCMAAYNDIDGIPCHLNQYLLTDVLRDELHFKGFVMSDGCGVDRFTKMCGGYTKAGALAIKSGIDLNLWNQSFLHLEEALNKKMLSISMIDQAVRRILTIKFKLGLFEEAVGNKKRLQTIDMKKQSQSINLKLAEETIVLLKNENQILPLGKKYETIGVVGPNAHQLYNQLGDYTPAKGLNKQAYTVYEGIKKVFFESNIYYAKGCNVRSYSNNEIKDTLLQLENAQVVVVVLGGSSDRNQVKEFDKSGAAKISQYKSDMDCGEGNDLSSLEIGKGQKVLLQELKKANKTIITVMIQGRPHILSEIIKLSDAVLIGWYPGEMGGLAIAKVLKGEVNPSGKLSVSIPYSVGQLPVYYNSKFEMDYVDISAQAQFAFGYGMSYTSFIIRNIKISDNKISLKDLNEGRKISIEVFVLNTGNRTGKEVIQLYLNAQESSITRRIKELKGFKKIELQPYQQKKVVFTIGYEELSIWSIHKRYEVEPGNVNIMIGTSSRDIVESQILKINP